MYMIKICFISISKLCIFVSTWMIILQTLQGYKAWASWAYWVAELIRLGTSFHHTKTASFVSGKFWEFLHLLALSTVPLMHHLHFMKWKLQSWKVVSITSYIVLLPVIIARQYCGQWCVSLKTSRWYKLLYAPTLTQLLTWISHHQGLNWPKLA